MKLFGEKFIAAYNSAESFMFRDFSDFEARAFISIYYAEDKSGGSK